MAMSTLHLSQEEADAPLSLGWGLEVTHILLAFICGSELSHLALPGSKGVWEMQACFQEIPYVGKEWRSLAEGKRRRKGVISDNDCYWVV